MSMICEGNPAAVCVLDEQVEDKWMQNVAVFCVAFGNQYIRHKTQSIQDLLTDLWPIT